MTPDNRNILFSAKVSSRDNTLKDTYREYEVSHLTCFLGGMFALGGRIFENPEDVDIGARLTEGCVWAYETMPAGVMPEYARVAPCLPPKGKRAGSLIAAAEDCQWDEKVWHKTLDPMSETRDDQMIQYRDQLAEWKVKKAEVEQRNKEKAKERKNKAGSDKEKLRAASASAMDGAEEEAAPSPAKKKKQRRPVSTSSSTSASRRKRPVPETIFKGEFSLDDPGTAEDDAEEPVTSAPSAKKHTKRVDIPDNPSDIAAAEIAALEKKIAALEEQLRLSKNAGRNADSAQFDEDGQPSRSYSGYRSYSGDMDFQTLIVDEDDDELLPPEPIKPATHKEYVASRLKDEKLPPGYTDVGDPRYILR